MWEKEVPAGDVMNILGLYKTVPTRVIDQQGWSVI